MNLTGYIVKSPPNPPPPISFSSSGQSPARQQDMADPAATPDYIHESGCRLAVWMQSRIQSVFLLFFGRCGIFGKLNKCSLHKSYKSGCVKACFA